MARGRGKGADGSYTLLICACVCVLLITSAVLIGVAFSKLDANEVGLNYSHNSETIDESKTYTPGTKFLGVGHTFIDYPTAVQNMDLANTSVRTEEGVKMTISANVHYRLVTNSTKALLNLYLHFGETPEAPLRDIMLTSILDASATFTAFEWYTYRDNVTIALREEVRRRMKDYYCTVDTLLLSTVTFPAVYVAALAATETAKQDISKVAFEIQQAYTEVQTLVLAAEKQTEIIALTANSTATSVGFQYEAERVRIETITTAQVNALSSLQSRLSFSQSQLNSYVWLDTMNKLSSLGTVAQIVQFDPPSLLTLT